MSAGRGSVGNLLRYVMFIFFPARVRYVMAVCGYREILESLEYPGRWKEKTLQAG